MLIALLLLAAAQNASAFDVCLNSGEAANGIQSAMQRCVDEEFYRQDARLNRAYKARMAVLPAPRKVVLRGLQRQWILDRDRRCRVRDNGQMSRFNAADCKATMTASRTRWLERYR